MNNGASSPFAQLQAFGNNRRGLRSLYNGNLGFSLRNSALDARSFSLTGQDTPKPGYNQMQGLASFGGPLRIPGLINRNGPNFIVNYQWVHNRNASTQTGLMPTLAAAQRRSAGQRHPASADQPASPGVAEFLSAAQLRRRRALQLPDPADRRAAPGRLQTRMNKQVKRNQFSGTFAMQSTRTDNTNLFGFLDTGRTLGINTQLNWRHQLTPRAFVNFGYQFSRSSSHQHPVLRESRERLGPGGNHRQQSGPGELGPAGALLRQRNHAL